MKSLVAILLVAVFSVSLTGTALALSESPSSRKSVLATTSATTQTKFASLREKIASRSSLLKDRLAGAKLQACEKVEKTLTERSQKMSELMTKHFGVLEKIQAKIEALAAKRVAAGKTINGYAGLLTAANAAKEKAADAVAEVKDPPSIDCSSDNPKGAVAEFNSSFKSGRTALQNYHRALRNLLVAVASVTGQENKSATSSAKPATTSATIR